MDVYQNEWKILDMSMAYLMTNDHDVLLAFKLHDDWFQSDNDITV